MVAFTLVDSDSDGHITVKEFAEIITSALKTVTVCSKIIQGKVVQLSTNIRQAPWCFVITTLVLRVINKISAINIVDSA